MSLCMCLLGLEAVSLHAPTASGCARSAYLPSDVVAQQMANGNCLSGNPLATQPRRRRETR